MIELLLLTIACVCLLSILWSTLATGISPMPSSKKACRAILIASEQADHGSIIDLGCGWGTLLFALVQKYPGRPIIGYELSWLPYLYCQSYKRIFRMHQLTIYRQNFSAATLSTAALLICYLSPQGMREVQQKMAEDPSSKTLLISSTFALPDTLPLHTTRVDDLYRTPIYTYTCHSLRQ
ncbi:MAG: class I SAM-dependent methyltransferase [Mariprofundus sp.]|nr:class I SAM-dependent methyltransferase [Mariprofundus sp.]